MKKKIAGVLTTVLAASLLVGGNHPVTVQVDNMISGTQDDEDTQSDEAEAAEAEEEQSEEAKVAADPEDQPAATETPKEEKKAEKETQKREAAENSSDSTSSDEKTLLKKAKKLAQQYDYTGAISVLKNNWKFATSDKMQEAAAAYMKKRDACVEYPLENITHVFFHSLIVNTSLAFDGDSDEAGYNQMMTTVSEFKKMLQIMYDKGYVLVSPHDMAVINDDGTMSRGKIMLPEGKIPFVLSEDDVSYYHYMDGDGFATKLVIDDNGDINPECEEAVMNELRGHFRPEFLNRIDEILVFHPLTTEQMQKIVGLMCKELVKRAKEQLGIHLTIRDSVKKHIVETGMDKKYGARPLRRAVQNQLEDKLAEAILSGEIGRDMDVVAGMSKKEIKFTAKTTN